ncbi:sigma 54-interacting transcriptional regulator [Fulvivirga lutea]|uniref:Sigma 54-interacting transcriptional regulator n=1 Tax=Fulvivirga lutea TaxID=2810512 RepID=A0A974WNP0_9BACT|nr:sigma 54-interacting transcriptional regulator [Fulvivirga lutea]QSE98823.1 sigma 54-interacting transcriptional regulator [Fulvivirga lutea]
MVNSLHNTLKSIGHILDQIDHHICLLNEQGDILLVNKAWKDFASENGAVHTSFEGANYFHASNKCEAEVEKFIAEVKKILSRKKEYAEVAYPCHSPTQKRWFKAKARQIIVEDQLHAIIIHENQTTEVGLADEIELLLKISEIIHHEEDFLKALNEVLKLLCDFSQWTLAEIWLPQEEASLLKYSGACYCKKRDLQAFCEAAKEIRFEKGVGLPGRVWATKKYLWIENLAESKDFLRAEIANELGINSGLALPILFNDSIHGIMAFFHDGTKKKDQHLSELIFSICKHLGLLYHQKNLADRLKKEKIFMRSIADDQSEMIVRWKPDGKRLFVNRAYCEKLGITEEEALGTSFYDQIPANSLVRVKKIINELTPDNPVNYDRNQMILADGSIEWHQWMNRAFFNEEGKPIEYQSVGQNITTAVESQAKLEENKERLQLTLESAKVGTFDWYPKEDQLFWDDRLFEIFEVEPTLNIDLNAHFFNVVHPDDKERVTREFQESLTEGGRSSHEIEYRIVINGKTKYILAHSRIFRDKSGEVIRMLGASQDITEIREAENFLQLVLDSASIGTFENYPQQDISNFDNKFREIFGIDKDEKEELSEAFFSRIHHDDLDKVRSHYEERIKRNGLNEINLEYRIVVGGKVKNILGYGQVIRDGKGEASRIVGTVQDITPLRESEERMRKSEERYRNIFNQQFQYSAFLDMEGKILEINDLALKTQRVSKESFVGRYFWNSPGWEGDNNLQRKVKKQIDRLKDKGESFITEDEFTDPLGQIHYSTSHYSLIRNQKGEPENILVQAIDVTNEKRSKKEVIERERKLSLIYSNTNDFILLIRCEEKRYVLEEINDRSIELLKFFELNIPKSRLIGISMREVYEDLIKYPKEKVEERIKNFDLIKDNRKHISYQQSIQTGLGLLVTSVDVVPVIQADKVTHLLMVAKDITENYLGQKKLEEAYEEVKKLKAQLEQENIYLQEEIKQANDFENMVFKSKEFRSVLNKVEQVANTDATVLITGETGTGKELIARAIHNVSNRSVKPMIKLNAAAIPKDLIESELFGYEKGAFTGATTSKPGKFELADGGSIFLDEIGDMTMDLQVKILRVLQEGEVERLGSTSTKKVDVRVITATNKDLEEAVKEGKFREDLFYRLNVFPIKIPPLRSRPDDVPILVQHFISKYNLKHSKNVNVIPKTVMDYLRAYTWPGNIRELENTIERAIILSSGETFDLPEVVNSAFTQEKWEHDNSLDVVMQNHIRQVLKSCNWKIEGENGAAVQLKIKPSTLRDKMKKFNIERPN